MLEEIQHLTRFTGCPDETVFTIEFPERCKEDFQGWKNKNFDDNVFYVSLKSDKINENNKELIKKEIESFYFPETGFINVKFYKEEESPVPTYIKFK